MVRRNDYNNDQYANEFGIKVTDELVTVDARVLPAPTVSSSLLHHYWFLSLPSKLWLS